MKKILSILSVTIILIIGFMSYLVYAESYIPYVDPGKYVNISKEPIKMTFVLPDSQTITKEVIYYNNRICVPLRSMVEKLGGKIDKSNNNVFKIVYNGKSVLIPIDASKSNRCVMVYNNGIGYISLYSLLENFDLTPVFDIKNNKIKIYKKETAMSKEELTSNISAKPAYIRFEDIMPDGIDENPSYTAENLEKLLYIANYMYARGEEYYIAWIPLYNSPATNCMNNISKENNLYNACFVYTLDYMVDHGGHIGLHGYTHQYGNDRSADGYEWGYNTPYTFEKLQMRMIYAKTIAARMGYEPEFFEFPHYAATPGHFKMAENYFDVIYQAYPDDKLKNKIAYTDASGKRVYYIPTPADYVHNSGDAPNTIERLKIAMDNNYEVSLFYHPTLDVKILDSVKIITDEKTMTKKWSLDNSSVLKNIVDFVKDNGYKFTSFLK